MKIHGHSSFLLKIAEESKKEENKVGEKLIEEQLRDNTLKYAPNAKPEEPGTTEKLLNEASKDFYPHRNPKAADINGDKRPINSLPKELGSASVEKRDERYEKANKSASFNLQQEKYAGYINYKGKNGFNSNNEKASNIDLIMTKIMKNAQKREMTEEEKEIITVMKQKKQELLG